MLDDGTQIPFSLGNANHNYKNYIQFKCSKTKLD